MVKRFALVLAVLLCALLCVFPVAAESDYPEPPAPPPDPEPSVAQLPANPAYYWDSLPLTKETYPVLGGQLLICLPEAIFTESAGYKLIPYIPPREELLEGINEEDIAGLYFYAAHSRVSITFRTLYQYSGKMLREDAPTLIEQNLTRFPNYQMKTWERTIFPVVKTGDGLELLRFQYDNPISESSGTVYRGMYAKKQDGGLILIEIEAECETESAEVAVLQFVNDFFDGIQNGPNGMKIERRWETVMGNRLIAPEGYAYIDQSFFSCIGGYYYDFFFEKPRPVGEEETYMHIYVGEMMAGDEDTTLRKLPHATVRQDSFLGEAFEWVTRREDPNDPASMVLSDAWIYLKEGDVSLHIEIRAEDMDELRDYRTIIAQIDEPLVMPIF